MGDQIRNPKSKIQNPSVDLHIEALVLDGFVGIDRAEINSVVQRELTRLFMERGVPASLTRGGDVASLEGGEFQVTLGANAQVIGSQIAQAVYGGLGR